MASGVNSKKCISLRPLRETRRSLRLRKILPQRAQRCSQRSQSRRLILFLSFVQSLSTRRVLCCDMKEKILIFALFILVLPSFIFANDGVFYASGNTLVPLQETQVQLRREILKFFVIDHEFMNVEVDFEFYNPGKARTLTVGFVTPPADGDVSEEEQKHPFVSNFTVNVNDRIIAFKIKKMNETSFKMGEAEVRGDDFVYYFPVTFKKGLNKIRHTYRFRGSSGVELQRAFEYQITTGKRWANKQIDDFEVQIHLDNGVFAIPASFISDGKLADWRIVGDGVIEDGTRQWFSSDEPRVRMVHLNKGYLSLKEKNFKPDTDIFFGEYNWAVGWASVWCEFGQECFEPESLSKIVPYFNLRPYEGFNEDYFAALGKKELKYVRNYFYAVRGFPFKDAELKNFYKQFFWYKPNESVRIDNVQLSKAESAFLAKIKRFEEKRK